MPILNFLFSPTARRRNSIGALQIEATISEIHSANSRITSQNIQQGSVISDHIINDPDQIEINGFISNTPLRPASPLDAIPLTAFLPNPSLFGANQNDHAQTAYTMLYGIRARKETVTVVSKFRVYRNMAISSINIPRDQTTGDAIQFTIQMSQITRVNADGVGIEGDIFGDPNGQTAHQAGTFRRLGRLGTTLLRGSFPSQAVSSLGSLGGLL